ncbi:hypothetical protein N7517_004867 [Penicillium concentricum]|uniref:Glycine zipper 2TM domain-containing protein n=1 Tax=Penicillium concentricum TaxID=293559 RepID=A0A9W9S6C1_9EURO|nr:uncharacterized protein N7517_004867 [Penicillium concentricum]KAJ5372861.1 hypothetical protein N7517_004867 [Penicillium concentricum]
MSNRDYYGDNAPEQPRMDEFQHFNSMSTSNGSSVSGPVPDGVACQDKASIYQQTRWDDQIQTGAPKSDTNGERGMGATLVGGTGGAFVGHHVGKKSEHGVLGAIGGAIAGAVLANMTSNAVKGNHHGRGDRRRERLERKMDRLGLK